MKQLIPLTLTTLFLLIQTAYAKPNIHIIATGGTISGAGESSTGSKYQAAQIDISQIINSVDNIQHLANLSAEQIFQKSSQDLNNKDLITLAQKVDKIIRKKDIDGIVITHGTDTLEESAYFLNLVIRSSKPIILVGSMRPSTSISADGSLNLYNGVAVAASKKAKGHGVLVVMNDNIYQARGVRKSHTTNVDSFIDDNLGKLGQVYFGKVDIYQKSLKRHSYKSSFDIRKIDKLAKVDIIYTYINFDEKVIDYYVNSGTKAIIVAGVGDGNVSQDTMNKLIEAANKGVAIIRSNRGFSGKIIRNVEIDDNKYGFITANNLTPQKARILAMVALTKVENINSLQRVFDNY